MKVQTALAVTHGIMRIYKLYIMYYINVFLLVHKHVYTTYKNVLYSMPNTYIQVDNCMLFCDFYLN